MPAAFAAAEMAGANGRDADRRHRGRLRNADPPVPGRSIRRRTTTAVFIRPRPAALSARRPRPGELFQLDAEGHANAFGIVLSMAAGSMQFLVNGAWTKRSHVGHAAMCGLIAATLAREGYKGAADALEGKWGFLHAYAPAADAREGRGRARAAAGRR